MIGLKLVTLPSELAVQRNEAGKIWRDFVHKCVSVARNVLDILSADRSIVIRSFQSATAASTSGALDGVGSPGFHQNSVISARLLHDAPAGEFDRGPA